MFKLSKWLWQKAQEYGEQRVIAMVHSRAEYHRLMAETAYLKSKYEPEKDDDTMRRFERPRHTPQEHSAINGALRDILGDYYRQKENEVEHDGR